MGGERRRSTEKTSRAVLLTLPNASLAVIRNSLLSPGGLRCQRLRSSVRLSCAHRCPRAPGASMKSFSRMGQRRLGHFQDSRSSVRLSTACVSLHMSARERVRARQHLCIIPAVARESPGPAASEANTHMGPGWREKDKGELPSGSRFPALPGAASRD
jgi:hypothetical protein